MSGPESLPEDPCFSCLLRARPATIYSCPFSPIWPQTSLVRSTFPGSLVGPQP